jgi:hypothetical protein
MAQKVRFAYAACAFCAGLALHEQCANGKETRSFLRCHFLVLKSDHFTMNGHERSK